MHRKIMPKEYILITPQREQAAGKSLHHSKRGYDRRCEQLSGQLISGQAFIKSILQHRDYIRLRIFQIITTCPKIDQQGNPYRNVLQSWTLSSPRFQHRSYLNGKGAADFNKLMIHDTRSASQNVDSSWFSYQQGSSPSNSNNLIVHLLSRFEETCAKLLDTISNHGTRLMNIEYNLGVVLACKLDTLIGVGIKTNECLVGRGTSANQATSLVSIGNERATQRRKESNAEQDQEPFSVDFPQIKTPKIENSMNIRRLSSFKIDLPSPNKPDQRLQPKESIMLRKHSDRNSLPLSIVSDGSLLTDDDFERYVRKTVGSLCSSSTEAMYREFCEKKLQPRELKAVFAGEIMKFSVGFTKAVKQFGRCNDHEKRTSIIGTIDESLRNTLQYLIQKYPPSKQKIVDTEMAKYITEVRNHTDLENDILRNAGMSFVDNSGKSDFARQIKIWINKLLGEVRRVFPKFKKNMEEMFRGYEASSIEDANEEVEYEIGTKLNEHIELYSEEQLNMPGLEIKSPQVGRVLTKWIEELHKLLFNPEEVLNSVKSGFKNMSKSNAIYLTEAMKKEMAEKLQQISQQKVQALHKSREKGLLMAISEVLTLVQAGVQGHEELNEEEIIFLNAAKYLNEYGNVHILMMLNTLLESLNALRKSYPEEKIQSNIDLVTCNILDTIRCKCVGSKKDIKRIYSTLSKHSEYEIIRVKVKLNSSTRDILINFKCRNSFLIGEMQLALGSKDVLNETFCHELYELQRSLFPVLYEVSSQIVSHDTRMAYFNNEAHCPQFKPRGSRQDINQQIRLVQKGLQCAWKHEPTIMSFHQNSVPFCCSLCSKFYGAYNFGLEFLKCDVCGVKLCPKCAIRKDKAMESIYIDRHIHWRRIKPFLSPHPPDCSFGTGKDFMGRLKTALKTNPYVLVLMFTSAGMKLMAVKNHKKDIIETFFTLYERQLALSDSRESWNCIMLPAVSQSYSFKGINLLAKITLDDQPWYNLEKKLQDQNIDSVVGVIDERSRKILVLDVYEDPEAIESKIFTEELRKYIAIENNKPDPSIQLTSKCLTDLAVLDRLARPESVKSLNLWGNKLTSVEPLKKFQGLTELILRQNKLTAVDNILPFVKGLRILNLQKNNLRGTLPNLGLPHLNLLDLSKNQLTDANSLGSTRFEHIKILYLSYNHLTSLPVLDCPCLEVYSFTNNELRSIDEMIRSRIPRLKRVRALCNKIEGWFPRMDYPELQQLHIEDNQLTNIEALGQCQLPMIERLTLSKNVIRGKIPELHFPKLKKILLNNNNLQSCLEMSRWVMPSITEIDLSQNQLGPSLPKLTLPSLKTLLIPQNRLTDVLRLGDSKLNNLQSLVLSKNFIEQIPVMALGLLKVLDLQGNRLRSLEELSEQQMPHLEKLILSNNQLRCRVPILHMPNLQQLVIDENDVQSLTCLSERQLIPSIKRICVKGNRRVWQRGEVILFDEEAQGEVEIGVLLRRRAPKEDHK